MSPHPLSPHSTSPRRSRRLRPSRHTPIEFVRRREMYRLIEAHPGIHLRLLSRQLSVGLGVLRYHLRVLRRWGLIRSRRTGRRRVFYVAEYEGAAGRSRREVLLERIEQQPGVTPSDLARDAGLSRMLVNYHLQRLRRQGEVRAETVGRRVRVYRARRGPTIRPGSFEYRPRDRRP